MSKISNKGGQTMARKKAPYGYRKDGKPKKKPGRKKGKTSGSSSSTKKKRRVRGRLAKGSKSNKEHILLEVTCKRV